MSTLKPAPRPALQPVADPAVDAPLQNPAARPDGGLAAEDMGLVYSLPAGWKLENDPLGAKYRYYAPGGAQLASLFIFKPENMSESIARFHGTGGDAVDVALSDKLDQFGTYQRFAPVAMVDRKIAGLRALVYDCTFLLDGRPVFYRWVVFAVPKDIFHPSVESVPTVQPFAFMTNEPGRANELKKQWDAIIDSMRVKGDAAPPTPADKGGRVPPPPRPKDKDEGGLPDLQADEPGPGLYAEPFGRYQVALPEGAVQVKIEENAAYYKMPSPKTGFIIHSYRQDEIGPRLAARFADGRKLNGAPSTLTVGGREAVISLYTAKDAAGENMVWVAALYPKSGLFIMVNLPAKDYAGAKEWIGALVRGVRF